MLFEQLGLSTELLKAISDSGYKHPTPIQSKAIPVILEGRDVMGAAQTGTGKTAGFTLPLLRRLEVYANSSMSPAKHPLRALILVPTRELAIQVHENVKNYGKYTRLKSSLVFGGVNIEPQTDVIRSGIEILVATPGRLLDHIQQKNLNLSSIEIFVLDEADRMLDMGFLPDIVKILNLLPDNRQNLMFSATFSDEIKKLAKQFLRNPVLIEVARQNAVSDLITHSVYTVDSKRKIKVLIDLIKQKKLNQVLIFTKTKSGSDRIAKQLMKESIAASAIHGDKNQQQRCHALNAFKQGAIRALVATDVAARGLDIAELSCVVNYELPNNPEDYVHRIGRTGRAGIKGDAISLVSLEEQKNLRDIEKLIQKKIEVKQIFTNDVAPVLKNTLRASKITSDFDKKRNLPADNKNLETTDFCTEVIFFNGERSIRENAQTRIEHDPLFTQPYVSRESKLQKNLLNRKVNKFPLKSLPALFFPSTNRK
ncbi:MAG: DEAD/DEAH box helicase [Nitrosomonas sp.]|nr:DEAD/DEAH box helicase [Nitrosomonas sp.]MCW5608993.1 DEAD/DEAH box helicase [Nitrosomonas sp.]